MKEIKELIDFLTAQKVKQIDILTEKTQFESKTGLLYEGIKNNSIVTDKDAIRILYDTELKTSGYKKLKYRLKQKLINTLFFVDTQSNERGEDIKITNLLKNWGSAQILKSKKLYRLSIELQEKILTNALKLERHDIAFLISIELQKFYGIINIDSKKYQKYRLLNKALMSRLEINNEVESMYLDLGHILLQSKKALYNQAVIDIENRIHELEPLIDEHASYYLKYYQHNALYFIGMIKNDNEACKKACDNAIAYYYSTIQNNKLSLFSFTQKYALIHLKELDFKNCLSKLNECLTMEARPGTIAWQTPHSYKFLVGILMGEYLMSYETISYVMNHKAFAKVTDTYKQHWYLKEALMIFLLRIGKVDLKHIKAKKLRAFRFSRLVNEVHETARDLDGFKITVNIIKLLFLILNRKEDAILNNLMALKQFSHRNLKGPKHIRPRTFIKMLLKLGDSRDPNVLNQKTIKLRATLTKNAFDYSEASIRREIIPYEQLWTELMSGLDSYTT